MSDQGNKVFENFEQQFQDQFENIEVSLQTFLLFLMN